MVSQPSSIVMGMASAMSRKPSSEWNSASAPSAGLGVELIQRPQGRNRVGYDLVGCHGGERPIFVEIGLACWVWSSETQFFWSQRWTKSWDAPKCVDDSITFRIHCSDQLAVVGVTAVPDQILPKRRACIACFHEALLVIGRISVLKLAQLFSALFRESCHSGKVGLVRASVHWSRY